MALRTPSLAVGAIALALGCAATAAQVEESDLKAAFVFNFAAFVAWPEGLRPGERLVLCDGSGTSLSQALTGLDGKAVNGHRVAYREVRRWDQTADCHALVLPADGLAPGSGTEAGGPGAPGPNGAGGSPPLVHPRGLLTVADGGEPGLNGAVITLVRDGSRVRFDVDTAAAARAEITLSSKLLRLARRVL